MKNRNSIRRSTIQTFLNISDITLQTSRSTRHETPPVNVNSAFLSQYIRFDNKSLMSLTTKYKVIPLSHPLAPTSLQQRVASLLAVEYHTEASEDATLSFIHVAANTSRDAAQQPIRLPRRVWLDRRLCQKAVVAVPLLYNSFFLSFSPFHYYNVFERSCLRVG